MSAFNIEFGRQYPLKLSQVEQKNGLVTFQYHFKPRSITSDSTGILAVGESGVANLSMSTTHDGNINTKREEFQGHLITGEKFNNEYVMTMVSGEFVLSKVSASVRNLRHLRNEEVFGSKSSVAAESLPIREVRNEIIKRSIKRPINVAVASDEVKLVKIDKSAHPENPSA